MLQDFGTNTQLLSVLPPLYTLQMYGEFTLILLPKILNSEHQTDYYHSKKCTEEFC